MSVLEFDETSLDDMLRCLNVLKTKIGQKRKELSGISKNESSILKFNAGMEIIETDISGIFRGCELDEVRRYYVYAHCYPDKKIVLNKRHWQSCILASVGGSHQPFYIGKGTGERCYDLNRNGTHKKIRQHIKKFGAEVEVTILRDNLTESEALELESKLIDIYGVQGKGGKLANLDEGIKCEERRALYGDLLKEIRTM